MNVSIAVEALVVKIKKTMFDGIITLYNDPLHAQDTNVGSSCIKLCNQPRLLQMVLFSKFSIKLNTLFIFQGLTGPIVTILENLVSIFVYMIASIYLQWHRGLIILICVLISSIVIVYAQKLIRIENIACEKALSKSTEVRFFKTLLLYNNFF